MLTATIGDRPLLSHKRARVCGGKLEDVADLPIGNVHAVYTVRQLAREDDSHVKNAEYPKCLPQCLSYQASRQSVELHMTQTAFTVSRDCGRPEMASA